MTYNRYYTTKRILEMKSRTAEMKIKRNEEMKRKRNLEIRETSGVQDVLR